ncbi:endonuclease III domain-containing protein, partial [bacterium]|nr:endonuclease III domain-containing protein [bacterium]
MLKPTSKLIEEIDNRLLDFFGIPEKTIPANSLEALVRGILSQNTSDINRDRAFDRLKTLVPDFKDLFNTEQEEIEKAIKPAGLGRQRAERIKHLVGWLNEKYGNFNCDFLCDLEPNESFETLTSLPGIGVKTAAVFLLFVCGFDYFPVDTHIKRIFKRIGLFPSKFTAERIQLEISPY